MTLGDSECPLNRKCECSEAKQRGVIQEFRITPCVLHEGIRQAEMLAFPVIDTREPGKLAKHVTADQLNQGLSYMASAYLLSWHFPFWI